MRYISHLDLVRVFYRALRRSGLPIVFTSGFTSRPKVSFSGAIKLGVEAEDLKASIYLEEDIVPEDVRIRLNRVMPMGISVTDVSY